MKRFYTCIGVMVCFFVMVLSAEGGLYTDWTYKGSIPYEGLVVATGSSWVNQATLFWGVNQESDLWKYGYTFEVGSGQDISHFIIEVSDTFTKANYLEHISGPDLDNESPQMFSEKHPATANMPAPMFGIKWDASDNTNVFTVEFLSDKSPMWGDFYARDGNGGDVYAHNKGFGDHTYRDYYWSYSGKFEDGVWKLLTPDTGNAQVPVPPTILLLGSGLAGLALKRLRRKNGACVD